ncbi:DNA ligase-like protein [Ralstonia phage RpT1]|nr:DNA ligase-like protein [Ralstonia phage RpT1]
MTQQHYLTNGYHEFKPRGAVSFNKKAIAKAIEQSGLVLLAYKIDGVRVILQVHPDGRVTCTSRSSKVLPALRLLGSDPYLRGALKEKYPRGVVLDCEVSVKGRSFQEGSGDLRRKTPIDPASLIVWPILKLAYDEVATGVFSPVVLDFRRSEGVALARELAPILGFTVKDPRIGAVTDVELIDGLFNGAREAGYEGLIAYDPLNEAFSGGKLVGWWKVKPEDTIDGKVINWGEGTGKFAGVTGFVTVEYEDGTVGDVGTFEGNEEATRALTREQWIGRYVEVRFMERTDDGNLRHPVFVQFRDIEGEPGVKS